METRQLELPAVEIARRRMDAVMQRKARATAGLWLLIGAGILAVAWTYADLGPFQLVLLFLAGGAAAAAVSGFRAHARVLRSSRFLLQSLHPDGRPGVLAQVESTRRQALAAGALATALVTAIVIWTATGQGQVWVVLACLVALIVFQLSMGLSGTSAPEFVELARAARESGVRIAVFRPFGPLRSSLARNALVPILAGYGGVEIVMDPTLEETRPTGILGSTYKRLRDLAEVHRYNNEDWQEGVEAVIKQADIAIIDISVAREGVTWEMAKCYEYLPPHRVYCAVDSSIVEKEGSLIDHVRRIYDLIESQADTDYPRNVRPYVFTFWPVTGHQLAIAQDVHRKMSELVAIDVGAITRPVYYSDTPDDTGPGSPAVEARPDTSHPTLTTHPERVNEALEALQPGAINFGNQQVGFSFNLGCGGLFVIAIVILVLIVV